MEKLLQLRDLKALKEAASENAQMGDDYMYCRVKGAIDADALAHEPTRFTGLGFILLHSGRIDGEINLKPIAVQAPALVMIANGIVIKNNRMTDDTEMEILFMSSQFIQDLNLDLNVINLHDLIENKPKPVIDNIPQQEVDAFASYFSLMRHNAAGVPDATFSKNIARSLAQGIFYQLLQLHSSHTERARIAKDGMPQSRQIAYVQEFMRLLQIHHKSRRDIAFYAEKLCISPKYLSHIIKEATSRSASDWIAEFVTMEAKNMLRYSHKNIQQVAYELNFSTQSSFGKYFKHATGMSPTEFQKT